MLFQQILGGISIGFIYAIVAVGYSLVFGVLGIMNMAHASTFTLGAHFILMFITLNFGVIPGFIASLILTGIITMCYDSFILSPLRSRPGGTGITVLITAIGFNYILQNLCLVIWGSERKPFPNIFNFGTLYIFGYAIDSTQISIIVVSAVLLAILSYLLYCTKFGLAMRAIQQNMKASKLMGINTKMVISVTFFISGASAVVASFMVASYYQLVYPTMGVTLGAKAFASAVLGGLGLLHGSAVGGLIIGILECIAVMVFGGTYRDAVAFIILILVLCVKPTGLFGKKIDQKV